MGSIDPTMPVIIVGIIVTFVVFCFYSTFTRQSAYRDDSPTPARPISPGRSHGLDANLIDTFPTFLYSEVKHLKLGKGTLECAVCLIEFDGDETLRFMPRCYHVFHRECIDAWLSSRTTCPVCRANLAEPDTYEQQPPVAAESNDVTDCTSVTIEAKAEEAVADHGSVDSKMWSKFPRSHSTGHSLVRPVDNADRFTLKLPDQIMREIMTRALNQTTSLPVLVGETSTRRGYRESGCEEGSNRGGKSYRRLGSLDRPDRWMVSMAQPHFARESSSMMLPK